MDNMYIKMQLIRLKKEMNEWNRKFKSTKNPEKLDDVQERGYIPDYIIKRVDSLITRLKRSE